LFVSQAAQHAEREASESDIEEVAAEELESESRVESETGADEEAPEAEVADEVEDTAHGIETMEVKLRCSYIQLEAQTRSPLLCSPSLHNTISHPLACAPCARWRSDAHQNRKSAAVVRDDLMFSTKNFAPSALTRAQLSCQQSRR